jgi:cob(I)alamin adenosyltransferase
MPARATPRLSRLVTRGGDGGSTSLADGTRLPKDDARIAALGEADELNCAIGLLRACALPAALDRELAAVQQELFDLGGALALPGYAGPARQAVLRLERRLKTWNAALPPLTEFVLPGGGEAAARAHLARATCRRAERAAVAAQRQQPLPPALLPYLNRLSDLLFVAARTLARGAESQWRGPRPRKAPRSGRKN